MTWEDNSYAWNTILPSWLNGSSWQGSTFAWKDADMTWDDSTSSGYEYIPAPLVALLDHVLLSLAVTTNQSLNTTAKEYKIKVNKHPRTPIELMRGVR